MMDNIPSIPDGIFDMRGPKTLDGGYSPSQKVSSAFKTSGDCSATFKGERIGEDGCTKALHTATATERITKLSLAIFFV
jgi:hypothetical protein